MQKFKVLKQMSIKDVRLEPGDRMIYDPKCGKLTVLGDDPGGDNDIILTANDVEGAIKQWIKLRAVEEVEIGPPIPEGFLAYIVNLCVNKNVEFSIKRRGETMAELTVRIPDHIVENLTTSIVQINPTEIYTHLLDSSKYTPDQFKDALKVFKEEIKKYLAD